MAAKLEDVEVERIFLYEENPRHQPLASQPEVIAYLCKDEQVLNLAKSIAMDGTNPLELAGIVELDDSEKSGRKKNYEVWEGNRRICAIKLLNDPDLAPAHLRKDFKSLTSGYKPIKKVKAVIFDDHDKLKFWMGVIHGGQQAGVGRRDWTSDQKERHTDSGRNKIALAVLDASEAMGLITKEDRAGKLTTAQRFLNSDVVRDALGINISNPDKITSDLPQDEFEKQLSRFVGDLKAGEDVTSRHNRVQIDQYGRKLAKAGKLSGDKIKPVTLKRIAATASRVQTRRAPKKNRKAIRINYHSRIEKLLEALGSHKLGSLHYSVCDISLEHHAPLVTVGVWAFFESLTARAGRNETTDFVSFCSASRLSGYGFTGKKQAAIRDALQRIQRNGNTTKHHEIAASFDGQQLANDFDTIAPLVIKIIESVIAETNSK